MAVIGKISLLASANPSKFVSDCEKMADALAGVERASGRVDDALGKSKTGEGLGAGLDGGRLGAELGAQIGASLGGALSSAAGGALGGLAPVAARIEGLIDRIGGTITTLARRIDEHIKFPILDKQLERIQKALSKSVGGGAKLAGKAIGGIEKVASKLSGIPLGKPFEALAKGAARGAKAIERMAVESKKAVDATRKALEAPVAPKVFQTSAVKGHTRKDGTQVKGYYRTRQVSGQTPEEEAAARGRLASTLGKGGLAATGGGLAAIGTAAKAASAVFTGLAIVVQKTGVALRYLQPVGVVALQGLSLAARGAVGGMRLLGGAIDLGIGGLRRFVGAAQWLSKVRGLLSNLGDVAGRSLSDIDSRGANIARTFAKLAYVFVPGAAIAGLTLLGKGLAGIAPGAASATLAVSKLLLRITGIGAVIRGASLLINPFRLLEAGAKTAVASTNAVTGTLNKAATSATNFGRQILFALGFFGLAYKVVDFFKGGVKGAIDLEETLSKTRIVFGGFSKDVEAQADRMAKAWGLPKNAILDAASSIGLIAQGAGISGKAAADMSRSLAQLAADASSFYNVPLEEALQKIRSGLVGESEPLRAFGVLLSEAAVASEAVRLGLAGSTKAVSESAKVAARASLIQRGLSAASGDLARTQDSVANQYRKSAGGIQNFATSIGQVLMPIIERQAASMNANLALIVDAFERNKSAISGWVDWVGKGMDAAGGFIANFGTYWKVAELSATQSIANLIEWIGVIPANLGVVGNYLKNNWLKLWQDVTTAQLALIKNLGLNIGNLAKAFYDFAQGKGFNFTFTPLLDGFKATADKLPEIIKPALTDMSKEIESELAKIKGREPAKAKANAPAGLGALAQQAAGDEKDKKEKNTKRFAGALELGSKEEYEARVNFRGGKDANGKAVAKNTENTAKGVQMQTEVMKRIEAKLGGQGAQLVKI